MKKTTKRNNLLELKPSSDWKDPAAPHPGKKRPVYTSGTLFQKETGRYSTPGLSGSSAFEAGKTDHIIRHGKNGKVTGVSAPVKKGTKARGAQRGVGQETLDGLDLFEGSGQRKRSYGKQKRR